MNNQVQQRPFGYDTLDEETRELVQRTADEIHGLVKRTIENIIKIGQLLNTVKERLPYGQFLLWIQTEFALSRWTAQNFMRVAEKFGDTWGNFHHMPASVLYELAAPSTSDAILEQIQSGHIPPTLDAVKAAKEAERQAREAEQQARTEAQLAQRELFSLREEAQAQQATIAQLTDAIEGLQEHIATLSRQTVQIKEVEKAIVPPEITAQLEVLRQQVQQITRQRDMLAQQVTQLGEEARAAAIKRDEGEQERRIRLHWFRVTNAFQANIRTILSEWPSPLDTQAFEVEDWHRLVQIKALARRFLEECEALTGGPGRIVVDASTIPAEEVRQQ